MKTWAAMSVACPFCEARPGRPCHVFDAEKGSFSRRETIFDYVHTERVQALPEEPEWAEPTESFLSESQLRAVRLHHPPRSKSEEVAFIPPPRAVEDGPKVVHPYYAPICHRRADKAYAPLYAAPPKVWTFLHGPFSFVAVSFGTRKMPHFFYLEEDF